ncbi:MAG: hypothetical protein JWN14_5041, partial [Chthonomonadales bacterium]|nr:hypothetical protein [Chthonomonadales bacterium]
MYFCKQNRNVTLCCCLFLTVGAASGGLAYQADPTSPSLVQDAVQTPQQLQQLVAPIALYPDALIAQILAGSTYPTQVVEANRWLQQHSGSSREDLAQQVNQQPWDPSVQALTQFPSVLDNLDRNLSWTSDLGDAYINQPQDVLDAVQEMRQQARQSGNLRSTPEETVTNEGQTIVIQPTNPDVVYVPAYNPWSVYGYPLPVYPDWNPVTGLYTSGSGISFGIGFGLAPFSRFGWGWHHWGSDWRQHRVNFNNHNYVSHSPTFGHRPQFNRGNTGIRNGAGSPRTDPRGNTGIRDGTGSPRTDPRGNTGSRPGTGSPRNGSRGNPPVTLPAGAPQNGGVSSPAFQPGKAPRYTSPFGSSVPRPSALGGI